MVRDGRYDGGARAIVGAMRRTSKRVDDDGAMVGAWRTAAFGAGHPYVAAGLVRKASGDLVVADVEQFRATHYMPDNATLVIAGRFDPILADRWIDFLFGDWIGRADARRAPPASAQPMSFAKANRGG